MKKSTAILSYVCDALIIAMAGSYAIGNTYRLAEMQTEPAKKPKSVIKNVSYHFEPDYKSHIKNGQVPSEYKKALGDAKIYANDIGATSKEDLFEQLTSKYGDNYSMPAAQYAVDHVHTNWNKQAVESGKIYINDKITKSKSELYDQLSSHYGDQFTPQQARYAVNKLYAKD